MQILKQNRGVHRREFKILESKLSYRERTIGKGDFETTIPFEELSNYKAHHETSNVFFAIFSVLFFLSAIGSFTPKNEKTADNNWIFCIIAGLICLAIYIIYGQNSWKIKLQNSNTFVFIYKKKPDEQTVNDFIEALFSARNTYLKKHYFNLDKNLNYEDQYRNLKWLNHMEAISNEEFEEQYQKLKILFNNNKKIIGFDRE